MAPMDVVDDNALIIIPRAQFSETIDFPMCDAKNSITVRIQIPDLKKITFVAMEEMVSDAWVSPTAVELRLPIAIAQARKMRAESRAPFMRERATESMERPPLASSYVKLEESIPMILDPVLRDYLKECLTYRGLGYVAYAWQKYKQKKHPSSRELLYVMAVHASNINAKSSQLSCLLFLILRLSSQTSWYR